MTRLPLGIIPLIFLVGCATTAYPPGAIRRISTPGVYHEVEKGQTLWHISKIYDVDLEKLIRANRMPDASKIEVGQLIFIPDRQEKVYKETYTKSTKQEGFVWPVKGVVVSYFGSMKDMTKNKGIDIEAPFGSDVVAARSGKVIFVSNHLKGYGKTIIIDHLDGFQTIYAYNEKNLVSVDQKIKKGEVIAKVGRTGRAAEPMLHFEIRREHKPQNPFYYLL